MRGRDATWALLAGFFVVHTVVWIGLVRSVPGADFVEYPELGVVGLPWVRQFVIPLSVVLILQIAAIRWLGWGRAVIREEARSTTWWLYLPVVFIVVQLVVLLQRDGISDVPAAYWAGLIATVLLVGATEEITFRGVLLVGSRRLVDREVIAFALSSMMFGLFHLPNVLLGQSLGVTLVQVVATAILGSTLYCLRRVSGSLLPCIALHAGYDLVVIQAAAG